MHIFDIGTLSLIPKVSYTVAVNDEIIPLTKTQSLILKRLADAHGAPVNRKDFIRAGEAGSMNVLITQIGNIRRAFAEAVEHDPIKDIRNKRGWYYALNLEAFNAGPK